MEAIIGDRVTLQREPSAVAQGVEEIPCGLHVRRGYEGAPGCDIGIMFHSRTCIERMLVRGRYRPLMPPCAVSPRSTAPRVVSPTRQTTRRLWLTSYLDQSNAAFPTCRARYTVRTRPCAAPYYPSSHR